MTAGEILVLIMLVLAGAWIASKILGVVWEVIGGPVSAVFWYFFEVRYPEEKEEPVRNFDNNPSTQHKEITSSRPQTGQTDQTDGQTDRVSAGDQWLARLKVDRKKSALIELLVYSGWSVGEIRSTIKGDSGAIGAEIQALRGGGDQSAPESDPDMHVTPIAGRVTRKEYYPDEPELEYQAP